ncbi:protein MGARP isoform 2-T2 [Thomomys bottae]
MYLRRAVSRTLALPRRAPPSPAPLGRDASLQRMSSNKVPGTSRSNMLYYLVVGVTVSAGGYYTYKTVISEPAKHTEHITDFKGKTEAGLQPLQDKTLGDTPEGGQDDSGATEERGVEAKERNVEEVPKAGAIEEASETTPGEAAAQASKTGPEVTSEAMGESMGVRRGMHPKGSHTAPDQEGPYCHSHSPPESHNAGVCPDPDEEKLPPDDSCSCPQHGLQEGSGLEHEVASSHDQ